MCRWLLLEVLLAMAALTVTLSDLDLALVTLIAMESFLKVLALVLRLAMVTFLVTFLDVQYTIRLETVFWKLVGIILDIALMTFFAEESYLLMLVIRVYPLVHLALLTFLDVLYLFKLKIVEDAPMILVFILLLQYMRVRRSPPRRSRR